MLAVARVSCIIVRLYPDVFMLANFDIRFALIFCSLGMYFTSKDLKHVYTPVLCEILNDLSFFRMILPGGMIGYQLGTALCLYL